MGERGTDWGALMGQRVIVRIVGWFGDRTEPKPVDILGVLDSGDVYLRYAIPDGAEMAWSPERLELVETVGEAGSVTASKAAGRKPDGGQGPLASTPTRETADTEADDG